MKFLPLLLLLVACDDAPAPGPGDRTACNLAVVASDYRSTAVSLLHDDGTLCAADILTSGSRPPGLLTALSGDVDLPSTPDPLGRLHLLDRYPNAVLTTVDPLTGAVLAQRSLSPGFAGNPQDLAVLDPAGELLLVSRLEHADALDLSSPGSDLLLLSPTAPSATPLTPFADASDDAPLAAMPTRFARAHGRLWVGLTHLTTDWSAAGPGRVLGLDAPPDHTSVRVTHELDLPTLQNCGNVAAPDDGAALWVVCSGLYRTLGVQLARSGVAVLDAPAPAASDPPAPLTPSWSAHAADLGGLPLAAWIAPLDADRAFVIGLGDLATGAPDTLLLVDRDAASATPITTGSGGPFELQGLYVSPDRRLLLMADANPRAPRLRRFRVPDGPFTALEELPSVTVSPSGLPPRHVRRLR